MIELDCLAKEPECFGVRVPGPPTSAGQPTQIIVVCIQIFSWFALCPLDFLALQLWCDCTHHAGSHMVLQIKHILERTIKVVRPTDVLQFRHQ